MSKESSSQLPSLNEDQNVIIESSSTSGSSALERQNMNVDHQHTITQDFILVCLYSQNTGVDDTCRITLTKLRGIVNTIIIFTDPNECIDFITDTRNLKIFLIISENINEEIISRINDIAELDAIWIFSATARISRESVSMYSKVEGVYAQMAMIYEAIKLSVDQHDRDSISMSTLSSTDSLDVESLEPSGQELMHFQLLKEVILNTEYDERWINNFIEWCRFQYFDNEDQLKIIDEFETSYHPDSSISWYTRGVIFYQILNRAVRISNFSTIIRMGFFIRDLRHELEKLHKNQFIDHPEASLCVYRGRCLSIEDFEKLKEAKDGLISFNSFLSTSENRETALALAEDAQTRSNTIRILFVITADLRSPISSMPFARINGDSSHGETECLFMMGSLFRINEVQEINNNERLYQVNLQLINSANQQFQTLTNRLKAETYSILKAWNQMGLLQIPMERIDTTTDEANMLIYNMLAKIHRKQADYKTAISFYEKALEIKQNTLSPNHPDLSNIFYDLALVHQEMKEYSSALKYFHLVLEIQEKVLPPNHSDLLSSYRNLARIYSEIDDFLSALSYCDKILEIEQKAVPINPPNLAIAYNEISSIYCEIDDYSRALLCCDKALEIEQDITPPNHSIVISTYNNIGFAYCKMNEYSKAFSWLKKVFDIQRSYSPSDDLSVADIYINMARVYYSMKDFLNAVSYYKKTLKIQQMFLSKMDLSVAATHKNIARAHAAMENYSDALSYYQNALKIEQKFLASNHPSLAEMYNNVAEMYELTGDYSDALLYYEKNLEILPFDHPSLADSYYRMSRIYCLKRDYERALVHLEKTLELQSSSLPPNHPSLVLTHISMVTILKSLGRNEEAARHITRVAAIASRIDASDRSVMETYQHYLKDFLATIFPVDATKKVKNAE